MSREAINIVIVIVRAVIIIIIVRFIFSIFSGGGVRGGLNGAVAVGHWVGRDSMAVGVEYHGGLGGIGIENTMVGGVVVYLVVSERARRISTREYVENCKGARL